jgi:hypothetical protein
MSVDPPIRAMESVSCARWPIRSLIAPSARPPIGRAKNQSRRLRTLATAEHRHSIGERTDVRLQNSLTPRVEPLKDVADQPGERRAKSRLMRRGNRLHQWYFAAVSGHVTSHAFWVGSFFAWGISEPHKIWAGLSRRPLCEENSATEIAATGKSGYAIGGTESQRLNGHGGLATAGSDETAAVA